MFDLDAYEEEVNLAHDDVLQVVSMWGCPSQWRRGCSRGKGQDELSTHFDLLYSNSMCRQSSIPTSILMELLLSGGMRYECTHISLSFVTSAIRREMVTRTKYLHDNECNQITYRQKSYTHDAP